MKRLDVIGNLGRDPESRYTPKGQMVTTVSVAVNTGYGDKKETEWMKATLWEKSAEIFAKLTQKGTMVWLSGVPKVEVWMGKDKEPHAQINLKVDDFKILVGFAEREESGNPYDEDAVVDDIPQQGE